MLRVGTLAVPLCGTGRGASPDALPRSPPTCHALRGLRRAAALGFAALTANLPSTNLRNLHDLRRLAVNNVNPNVTKLASRRGGCSRRRFLLVGFASLTANLPTAPTAGAYRGAK